MHRLKRVRVGWNARLAYVIGVIATDGNLSSDGRHINITSKDLDLILTIRDILELRNKIGKKARGGSLEKKYFVLQFGDINFYEFLVSIGLSPAKSKTLGRLSLPNEYFRDFLRGCIDGDGSIGAYKHPESRLLQLKLRLVSASPNFLLWILDTNRVLFDIDGGYICKPKNTSISTLAYGKKDSRKILSLMYYDPSVPALERKRAKAMALIEGE